MKKCVIITSHIEGNLEELMGSDRDVFILCADGGYNHAHAAGITPDLVLGDFDSLQGQIAPGLEVVTFPCEKNDTDTGLSIECAIERGFQDILIIGGIGGRFDHTIANIQSMTAAAVNRIAICDRGNYATILKNDQITMKRKQGQYISLLSLSDICRGVSITGVKYPLSDHTLSNTFPLGVSNEFLEDEAVVTVKDGCLLVVLSAAQQT